LSFKKVKPHSRQNAKERLHYRQTIEDNNMASQTDTRDAGTTARPEAVAGVEAAVENARTPRIDPFKSMREALKRGARFVLEILGGLGTKAGAEKAWGHALQESAHRAGTETGINKVDLPND